MGGAATAAAAASTTAADCRFQLRVEGRCPEGQTTGQTGKIWVSVFVSFFFANCSCFVFCVPNLLCGKEGCESSLPLVSSLVCKVFCCLWTCGVQVLMQQQQIKQRQLQQLQQQQQQQFVGSPQLVSSPSSQLMQAPSPQQQQQLSPQPDPNFTLPVVSKVCQHAIFQCVELITILFYFLVQIFLLTCHCIGTSLEHSLTLICSRH